MPALKSISREEQNARRKKLFRRAATGDLVLPGAVRDIRKALGMTQKVFAEKFGLTRIQVIELENGKANPTLETMMKIARPFGFKIGFSWTPPSL